MIGLTSSEIAGLALDKFFVALTTLFLFSVYFKPKKNQLRPLFCCLFFSVIAFFNIYGSTMIERGNADYFVLVLICSFLLCFWPVILSGFYQSERFKSQFVAYFTNSLNPFMFIAILVRTPIVKALGFPELSIGTAIIYELLFFIGLAVYVPVVKKFIVPRLDKIPGFIIKALVIGVPVSQIFTIMTNFHNNPLFKSPLFYGIVGGYGFTVCFAGFIIYKYAVINAEKDKLELSMKFEKAKNDYFDVIEEHSQTISKLSHDIKNHLRTMQTLADNHEYEEIKKYSEAILNDTITTTQNFCHNPTVNAMLMYYNKAAREKDIDFIATATIPTKTPLSSVDLVSLISNLLDNAFEACERVTEAERTASITITCDDNAFTCICKNTFDGKLIKKGKKFITQKTDTINHGLGTQIVTETANRLGGKCDFSFDEKTFSATVYIPITNN